MKYFLLIVGLILALIGFSFLNKRRKTCKNTVKCIGKVVDHRKVDVTKNMPAGFLAIADYEVDGKIVRGVSTYPAAQKYAIGYKMEMLYYKDDVKHFIPMAFVSAMAIYAWLFPIGMALAIWGVSMFF
ncbi:MAG: hypothetical protein IJ955_00205 [Oscillospiraceae bacterium]|nr:hypothetical protein [Oscillospiraceae bacterium]